MTENRYLQQRIGNLKALLGQAKKRIELLLPDHVDADRLIRICYNAVTNPKIAECDPKSVIVSALQCATLGLEPNTPLQEAHFVPYKKECKLIIGYPGFITLMRRTGDVADVDAIVVHENDVYDVQLGTDPKIIHKPCLSGDPGAMTNVYGVVWFMHGGKPHFLTLTKSDIEKVKKSSSYSSGGPWTDWYEEMAKKTAIRRMSKYVPRSTQLAKAIEYDSKQSIGEEVDITNGVSEKLLNVLGDEPDLNESADLGNAKAGDKSEHQPVQEPLASRGNGKQQGEAANTPPVEQSTNNDASPQAKKRRRKAASPADNKPSGRPSKALQAERDRFNQLTDNHSFENEYKELAISTMSDLEKISLDDLKDINSKLEESIQGNGDQVDRREALLNELNELGESEEFQEDYVPNPECQELTDALNSIIDVLDNEGYKELDDDALQASTTNIKNGLDVYRKLAKRAKKPGKAGWRK